MSNFDVFAEFPHSLGCFRFFGKVDGVEKVVSLVNDYCGGGLVCAKVTTEFSQKRKYIKL